MFHSEGLEMIKAVFSSFNQIVVFTRGVVCPCNVSLKFDSYQISIESSFVNSLLAGVLQNLLERFLPVRGDNYILISHSYLSNLSLFRVLVEAVSAFWRDRRKKDTSA